MSSGPDKPTDLKKPQFFAVLKRTGKQFKGDKLTHWAAALTYYGVLSLFPAIIAFLSILGLFGDSATQPLIDNISRSEEHTSELQSPNISYAVFCLKKKKHRSYSTLSSI